MTTHDKSEEAERQEKIAEEEAKLKEEQGDKYMPMGPFDSRNPAFGYNVIVFALEDAAYRVVWLFAYLIPTIWTIVSVFISIWYPWIINLLFFAFWPILWANGLYLLFVKSAFWDYDYANGNTNFLFIENPYLTYHDDYDLEYNGVEPVFV